MAASNLEVSIRLKRWAFWTVIYPQYLLTGDVRWVPSFAYTVECDGC